MPAQTIFFVGDKLHHSQAAVSVHSVSSTASGYNKEAVRDTNWLQAWKPSDGTADEYIQIDGGSAGWLGTTGGAPIHVAIAYDARGCDQTLIKIVEDSADNPAGTFVVNKDTFATLNTSRPCEDYVDFLLSGGGKRYYRIYQYNADRGGGTKTVPIYAIAFFTAAQVYVMDTEYVGNSPAPGDYNMGSHVGRGETAGGMAQTNRNGAEFEEFEVNMARATAALWDALRAHWTGWHGGPARPYWLQYDGLINPAKADFAMVRQLTMTSRRIPKQVYDTRLRFETVGKPI